MLTTRQWAESILWPTALTKTFTTVGLGIEENCGTVSASLKAPGIAAGIDLAREIFLAAGASVEVFAKDGDSLAARVPFLCARGSAQALHAAYKTAQCVMEYAGGIAERTRAMVDAARSVNPQAVVAGTRKHYPGGKRIALAGLLPAAEPCTVWDCLIPYWCLISTASLPTTLRALLPDSRPLIRKKDSCRSFLRSASA